jgi:hypothetical protein
MALVQNALVPRGPGASFTISSIMLPTASLSLHGGLQKCWRTCVRKVVRTMGLNSVSWDFERT